MCASRLSHQSAILSRSILPPITPIVPNVFRLHAARCTTNIQLRHATSMGVVQAKAEVYHVQRPSARPTIAPTTSSKLPVYGGAKTVEQVLADRAMAASQAETLGPGQGNVGWVEVGLEEDEEVDLEPMGEGEVVATQATV